jgi:ADP-heptose:LPS heptosyltransferase
MIKKIEYLWRHHFIYPIFREIFRNKEISLPIDIKSIKSILILRYDRIGDMIVTTSILKGLKEANPDLRIGIMASEANAEIVRYNPYIHKIHILKKNWCRLGWEIFKARREHYDVVLNLIFNRTTSGGILANLVAPEGIKIGQGDSKYQFYFNTLLRLTRASEHMVDILTSIIKSVFDVDLNSSQLSYNIETDEKTNSIIVAYWSAHSLQPRVLSGIEGTPYIIFNLSANDSVRRISSEQALMIGEYLSSTISYRTLLLHSPMDSIMLKTKQQLVRTTRCLSFPENGTASLLEIAAIIKGAAAIITPDTSIIHFASAAKTPVIGFYTSMQDVHEWLPYGVKNRIVLSEKNRPTSSLLVSTMIEAINDFLFELNIPRSSLENAFKSK